MARTWLRLYADTVDNTKLRLLAFEDRWHFMAILCCKAQDVLDNQRGQLLERALAIKLGLDKCALSELKRRLLEVNLIDTHWQPIGWDERQFQSDEGATERSRKFRRNKKIASKDATLQQRRTSVAATPTGNADETSMQRRCNGSDTDTDTEQKKNPPTPRKRGADARSRALRVAGLDVESFERWEAYRRESGKALKPASLEAAAQQLAALGSEQVAAVQHSIANGYQGLFTAKHSHDATTADERKKLQEWANAG